MSPQTVFLSSFTPHLHYPNPTCLRSHSENTKSSLSSPKTPEISHTAARLANPPSSTSTPNLPPQTTSAKSEAPIIAREHNSNSANNALYTNLMSANFSTPQRKPPHHYRLPLLGYFIENYLNPKLHYTLRNKYGPIYTSHLHTTPITVLASRHFVLTVLRENGEIFKAAGAYSKAQDELFGASKFKLDGEAHARMKLLTKLPFKVEGFGKIFLSVRKTFLNVWQKFENTKRYKKIFNEMAQSTFRIMVGITLEWDQVEESALDVSYMRHLFDKIALAWFTPKFPFGLGWYGEGVRARDELMEIIKSTVVKREKTHSKVIREMKELFEREKNPRHLASVVRQLMAEGKVDFVTLMLALIGEDDKLGDEKYTFVLKGVLGFWFAGTESPATLITSAVHELGNRPNVLARLIREQDDLVKNKSEHNKEHNQDSELTYDELASMPVLDAFFNEMCRLFGSAYVAFRKVSQDVRLGEYTLKKDTLIFCDLKAAMLDDDLFPDPMKFDLDRYLNTSAASDQHVTILRKQASMLGFGAGPHLCTGAMLAKLEFKTAVALLLRNYHLEVDPNASEVYSAVPRFGPESRTPIRLTRRV